MTRNTQHLMLLCTAVVFLVTACLYGQRNLRILTDALNERMNANTAMEGRVHTTLRMSRLDTYTGAEVLHTVRQMTGTEVQVEINGYVYVVDPLVNPSVMIPVELDAYYRAEYSRNVSGELLKLSFWKEGG
ncbi:hypothetical protein [Paenibacillus sp. FSL R7-0652]|uniref:hypothetical protein n=1 Tax=Paenibacillus sp. FSL R7-0652 TaxID=2921687 RepID=UPI00315B3924